MGASEDRQAYGEFLKPLVLERLHAIGMDVIYHRGRGDFLYYRDAAGEEIEVLDMLGGFGASLFGHNHPELVARARAILDDERPFHAQASVRSLAGRLAARLSERIFRATGRPYRVTLANSGTEATEAAVKHAELEAALKNERRVARMQETFKRVKVGLRNQSVRVPPDLLVEGARLLGVTRLDSLEDLFARISRRLLDAVDQEPKFLALEGAFHGKSTGSLMLTYNPEYRGGWERIGLRTAFLPPGEVAALEAEIAQSRVEYVDLDIGPDGTVGLAKRSFVNISGLVAEPIQGEGGIRELSADYLHALRHAADGAGFPFILDEIQCGMGRTGSFLASERSGVSADYYLLSKALGGGLAKVSALLVDKDRSLPDFGYVHTSTFADDDFSSAVALGTLELLDRDDGAILRDCREKGEYLLARLQALAARFPAQLRQVRGRGLMMGIELGCPRLPSARLLSVLGEQNLLGFFASGYFLHEHRIRVAPTLSAHGTLRLEPSAYISQDHLDRFCAALTCLLVALRDGATFDLVRALVGRKGESAPPTVPVPQEPSPQVAAHVGRDPGRVAFLAHFLDPADFRHWDPTLAALTPEDCKSFLDRTQGLLEPFHVDEISLRSLTGDSVEVTVIGIAFTPEQVMSALREGTSDWALDLVRRGVEMARQRGCSVVGFGGYTSIVSDNCRAIIEDDLALTSGNALTAAAALDALFLAARRQGIKRRRLGVVGAAGNIGAVMAEVAADDVEDIVLVGRPGAKPRLLRVAAELMAGVQSRLEKGAAPTGIGHAVAKGRKDAITVATDMDALRHCSLILTASNAPRPILLPQHIGEGPVVICDVAAPRDVDPSVRVAKPEALVLRGGVVELPLGQRLDIGGMVLAPGQVYGCLAETMLLGLARIREHFSYGRLHAVHLRRIRELARLHGFTVKEARDLD